MPFIHEKMTTLEADKGSAVVVSDREDYLKEANLQEMCKVLMRKSSKLS